MPATLLFRRIALHLAIATMLATFAPAQSSCLERSVIAGVIDEDGNTVSGLNEANFRVKIGREVVRVVSATTDQSPPRIVILLDASGSMVFSREKWELSRRFAGDVVTQSRPETPIGLIVFASKFHLSLPLSSTHDEILRTTQELTKLQDQRTGTTPLTDAIFEAVSMLRPPQSGDIIYLISDGEDNGSSKRVSQAQKALLQERIRLYGALLWTGHPAPIGASDFQDVARNTGGFVVNEAAEPEPISPAWKERYDTSLRHRAALAAAANTLYQQMSGSCLIKVETPAPLEKPKRLRIEVVDAKGVRRKGVLVSAPTEAFPCSARQHN